MRSRQLSISAWLLRWWKRERATAGRPDVIRQLAAIAWEFVRESTPERKRQRYGDAEYDWEYRVDTTSATVGWRARLAGLLHSPYQPVEPDLFREMMSALAIDFSRFTFIDIGSGKGRALLLAAEYPFRRILGVELLAELNDIARQNIEKFRSPRQKCHRIEARCGDATEFTFPAEPLVVFFFNPLPAAGLSRVLENLEALPGISRDVWVIYPNPAREEIFGKNCLLGKVGGTHQYALFRSRSALAERDLQP